jgi:hypothetical protein
VNNNLLQQEEEMKRLSTIVISAVFLMVTMIGCAPVAITGKVKTQQDAFGAKKKFAVVTIASIKELHGEKGITQIFKKTDDIRGAKTQPILDQLRPEIIKTLRNSKHFKLLPESRVLKSKAYKRTRGGERKHKVLYKNVDINVAKNYKYFSKPEKLAQLAKDFKVDGVITIVMNFSISSGKSWLSVAGVTFGKKEYSVVASISVLAYNREGKLIWKDTAIKQAEPGDKKAIVLLDLTDLTETNFKKLHPSAITISGKAVNVLLARLNDSMEGKSVSIFQKLK